jgi:hypothetical protein
MVDRIVLDVQLADAEPIRQAIAADQRREPGVEAGARLAGNRQQLTVPPQIFRPPFDVGARERNRGVVVYRFERTEAAIAHVDRLGREHRFAEMTLQSTQRAHTASDRNEPV